MKKVAVGILGLGRFGKQRLLLLREDRRVGKIAFYDPHLQNFNGLSSAKQATALFNDPTLQAIFICTPNNLMRGLFVRALQSGKHVFCEKPPGISLAEATIMAREAQKHRLLKVKFGFNHRYLSHYVQLKKYLAQHKKYGRIKWIRAVYGKGYDDEFYTTWRSQKRISGGGVLIDQGIHLLDLLQDLLGELNVIAADVRTVQWKRANVEDNVFALLESKRGVPIAFHSSMVHWHHMFRLEVATTKALFVMSGIKSSTRSYGDETLRIYSDWRDNFTNSIVVQRNDPDYYTLRAECREFIAAVMGTGTIVHGKPAEAVRIMKLINTLYTHR